MGGSTGAGFSYKNMPVADGSAVAKQRQQGSVQRQPTGTRGQRVKVGDMLRDVKVAQNDLSLVNIAETKGAGKVPHHQVVPLARYPGLRTTNTYFLASAIKASIKW